MKLVFKGPFRIKNELYRVADPVMLLKNHDR